MDVSVGTFNLNNLFGRRNLYVDAPQPPQRVQKPGAVDRRSLHDGGRLLRKEARRMQREARQGRKVLQPLPIANWLDEAPVLEGRTRAAGYPTSRSSSRAT